MGPTFLIPGDVFDVSRKRDVYGKGCSYNLFAGKDGSRGLGKSSLKPEDAEPDYTTLPENEMKVLDDWHSFFSYVLFSLLHNGLGFYIGGLTTIAVSQETVQRCWARFRYARSSSAASGATASTQLTPFVFPIRSYVYCNSATCIILGGGITHLFVLANIYNQVDQTLRQVYKLASLQVSTWHGKVGRFYPPKDELENVPCIKSPDTANKPRRSAYNFAVCADLSGTCTLPSCQCLQVYNATSCQQVRDQGDNRATADPHRAHLIISQGLVLIQSSNW